MLSRPLDSNERAEGAAGRARLVSDIKPGLGQLGGEVERIQTE